MDNKQKNTILCDQCFAVASYAIHFHNTKGFGAICDRCLHFVKEDAERINQHEMNEFGGQRI